MTILIFFKLQRNSIFFTPLSALLKIFLNLYFKYNEKHQNKISL